MIWKLWNKRKSNNTKNVLIIKKDKKKFYFLRFPRVVTSFSLLAALKKTCSRANSEQGHISQISMTSMIFESVISEKCFIEQNECMSFWLKYYVSPNNPSRANADFWEQIFARDCNNSRETEEVNESKCMIDPLKLNFNAN